MIIEESYWQIEENHFVIGITISGENVELIIPLAALGDAIKAAQEARDGQRDLSSVNATQES